MEPTAEKPQLSDDIVLNITAPASLSKHEEEEIDCRICFMPEDPETFCMPCACTAPVHLGCLERWCQEKGSPRCEICQAEYKLANKQQTIQNALDAHTARHRPPPRSALELLISGDHHNNEFTRVLQALRTGQRGGMTDAEEEEFIRQAQTRRLLVFAVMVVLCIIFFHIVGTLMMGDSTRMRNEHINPSPHTAHNGTSFHGNSTGHGPYNGRHDQNSPMGRFFRMMLFFYVIRMLFSRPPPPDRRGLYL
eukprot:TRINITY_DN8526_c0_g1_i1.p1 TRINITY_DN8526_c0_g1~~TRINITY_DN8526_c0_g1_i1.p1  ORF type:complete len:250 (-),score=29.43 TRINITY_DN8526_c0_g1_i1:167-916(-)